MDLGKVGTMNVEMVLDVACGWSYLSFARFERALSRYREQGGKVEVTFLPFQLDPHAPTGGQPEPLLDVLRHKFGANAVEDTQRFAAMAKSDGLQFNYDRAVHSNTFDAHRLITLATRQGMGEQMVERLFRAHYTDGLDVGDPGTLARLAAEVGVTVQDPAAGTTEVRAGLDKVRRMGVRGVPVFRFEGGPTLSGAQSEEALYDALRRTDDRVGRAR
jgi:predicted DsbA family dithiol-disulfide isomerase